MNKPTLTPQKPVFDMFADLFAKSNSPNLQASKSAAGESAVAPAIAPTCPVTLADSGLSLATICDMILRQVYLNGTMLGGDISRQLRLPFTIVDEGLRELKDQRTIEVSAGDVVGRVSYRFSLTELGRTRAREACEQCRYVGPAPVPLSQYIEQCRRQSVAGMSCNEKTLRDAFEGMVIRQGLLDLLGPAICSGKSIFIYGPPGNGKTLIAKGLGRFLNRNAGEIFVPYAIQADNSIITVFDPSLHTTTDDAELARRGLIPQSAAAGNGDSTYVVSDGVPDLRWRRVRRPVVVTGGELTLEMLELQYNAAANFYTAPLHIKANGGVFLIDDFGRQLVSPRDLLNRWIFPLEDHVDYLTLRTGWKLAVPFEQLIIFSTNLDPKDLVDDAFLRRIKHKIRIDPPDEDHFCRIFEIVCGLRKVSYRREVAETIFHTFYQGTRKPRSSDPRDLLELADSICRFKMQQLSMSDEILKEASLRFFHEL